jgi:glutathione peroxidase-family protein
MYWVPLPSKVQNMSYSIADVSWTNCKFIVGRRGEVILVHNSFNLWLLK